MSITDRPMPNGWRSWRRAADGHWQRAAMTHLAGPERASRGMPVCCAGKSGPREPQGQPFRDFATYFAFEIFLTGETE